MASRRLRTVRSGLAAALGASLAVGAPASARGGVGPVEASVETDATAQPADAETDAEAETDADAEDAEVPESRPPRLDGPYVGGIVFTGLNIPRVNGLDTGVFTMFGGSFRFGQMVLPWLGLGLSMGGAGGVRSGEARQVLGQGQVFVDGTFVPLAKRRIPLSLRASFGFGGGAINEEGRDGRSGYGGAAFSAAVGYTFFPLAAKKRPYRGGGFGLGPELGWIGFTPTGIGNPLSNTFYVGLTTTFFFGS